MANKRISWDKLALHQFNIAISHIAKDSIQNAEKVRREVLDRVEDLKMHPERNAPDKYKADTDGSYRACELLLLRIAYHISAGEVRIIRFRSTYQEPLDD